LLENALHASSTGDTIEVGVSSLGRAAVLTVTDSGVGFEPGDADRLFQRFFRASHTRSADVGSGIGLTIAASLVAAHGGTLKATSPGLGAGATFTLTLPLS
jgi:signal transduction histidine kinase